MKARVSNLHKTEAEWAKFSTLVPEAGELVVYDPDRRHNYARIKMGDGQTALSELPFFIDAAIATAIKADRREVIDAGRITDYTK